MTGAAHNGYQRQCGGVSPASRSRIDFSQWVFPGIIRIWLRNRVPQKLNDVMSESRAIWPRSACRSSRSRLFGPGPIRSVWRKWETRFSGIEWGLAVGLLVAGGFLFTSLIVQVDIRQRLDAWVFVAIGGIPTAVLGYGIYALGVGEVRVLDKLLGWATPYGLAAMGMLIGFALAAAVRVRPPIPVITSENLSTLSLPE